MNYDNALSYSSQWLNIIRQETFPEETQAKWIIDESKQNFAEHFNRGWLDFRGRSAEEELGDGWTEGIHADDYAACLRTYREAFDAREPFRITYRLRRFDGEYRHIFDTGVPRFAPNGTFLGYVGSAIDITDVKQAELALRDETALRASEMRFREIADAMPHMVWEARLDVSFDYFNRRWHEYTGIRSNDGTIETWQQIAHPDDWPGYLERWPDVARVLWGIGRINVATHNREEAAAAFTEALDIYGRFAARDSAQYGPFLRAVKKDLAKVAQ